MGIVHEFPTHQLKSAHWHIPWNVLDWSLSKKWSKRTASQIKIKIKLHVPHPVQWNCVSTSSELLTKGSCSRRQTFLFKCLWMSNYAARECFKTPFWKRKRLLNVVNVKRKNLQRTFLRLLIQFITLWIRNLFRWYKYFESSIISKLDTASEKKLLLIYFFETKKTPFRDPK